jgi:class 3 adenylate cyclase
VPPETRYARNGRTSLAYTVSGSGSIDALFVPGSTSHVEHLWEEPGMAGYFRRLGSFTRVIIMDRRGVGLSDPLDGPMTLDDEMEDLCAVLDAAESERAVLIGFASGGIPCLRLARRRPERVRALILYAGMAAARSGDGYEWATPPDRLEEAIDAVVEGWGTGAGIDNVAPSRAGDARLRSWMARMERQSSSPGAVRAMLRAISAHDAREDLEHLRVPTLILHRTGDRLIDVRHSRYMAEHIPGARYVELPGEDNLFSEGDTEALLGEMEEFLTGGRAPSIERRLLTVLFTDVVDSTGHAARLGDERWRHLLAAHDATVRRELERFGGREVKTIGDAVLATFEGPPSAALRCALAVVEVVHDLGLELRIGLHTGECEVIGDDVGGMAVHVAARVAALAGPGQILASGTTFGTVLGAGLRFRDLGMHELRGVHGPWPIFALEALAASSA